MDNIALMEKLDVLILLLLKSFAYLNGIILPLFQTGA